MRHALRTFLLLFLLSANGKAENLLYNPDFSLGLVAWTPFADNPGSTVGLATEDAGGDPDSGSVTTTTAPPGFQASGATQCTEGVVGGTTYDAGCRVLIPAGQAGTGEAGFSVSWFSSIDCTSGDLGTDFEPSLDDAAAGFWTPFYATYVAPAGALSARFALVGVVTGGAVHTVLFDGAILAEQGIEALPVFGDGFEGGGTSPWQSTLP